MSLEGRLALVSGASRGVGKAIALSLASNGADVAVNYTSNAEAAEETVAEIRALGRKANAYQADVASFEDDQSMVEKIVTEMGPVSILVHNAGVASKGRSVLKTDHEELAKVVGVHAFAAHYLSQLVIPSMRTTERGDIIVISSVASKSLGANGAPYNMGKAALEAFAITLSKEEKRNNIRVNIVAPGLVETDMGKRLIRATQGVEDIRSLDKHMPFGRVCQPEDIANVICFLVSPANSYVTGERIYVNGGD
ncbi:MAG: SDR family oxidoreductase [Pseudomonadales bacterium]|nr:SDR family oxidoreductase [Pseudomonadales bacterium]